MRTSALKRTPKRSPGQSGTSLPPGVVVPGPVEQGVGRAGLHPLGTNVSPGVTPDGGTATDDRQDQYSGGGA
ncbi:MAG TPA: hypothetical protein VGV91_10525 [Rubrobacter sp.]|jgi:hypothetical protein|nr:hypothetical protein [Rubrobacter sp.]